MYILKGQHSRYLKEFGYDITRGNHFLRALESSDLDYLYDIENDEGIWEISNTNTPYSKYVLKEYLANSHRDIFEVKQLRLVICNAKDGSRLGLLDLFDFDPKNKRVGLGVIIKEERDRGKGYAREAITLCLQYAKLHLGLHQIFAHIVEDNIPSIHLFESLGFLKCGVKKDWLFVGGRYKTELVYQYIYEQ